MMDEDAFTQEREKLHRQMLSAVSHDLKTPLASIIGSIEIFQRLGAQLDETKKKTLLSTALVEAYRLDSFLTNILDLAKLENNLVPIRHEPTNIRQTIDDLITVLGKRQGRATILVDGDRDLTIDTDAALLSRGISLLIDNAVKHAGEAPKIQVHFEQFGTGVQLDVVDNGPGVPIDKQNEIFNKYTRLNRGDMQTAGTGLGLSIARIIAQRLGGQLNLATDKHRDGVQPVGAHFVMTINTDK